VELDTVTSALVLLCKMGYMFFSLVRCVFSLSLFAIILPMEAPFILHVLAGQTAFDFLSQRHNKFCYFISDIMGYFLAGKGQPQTNQPNGQAGNQS